MERPGGECNASDCRTQQIDQDLQECVTRDAVGVGWLIVGIFRTLAKKRTGVFRGHMQNIT